MGAISIRIWLGGMLACSSLAVAQAQVASPVDIPLQLLYVPTPSSGPPFPPQWRLGINVGINGGQSHIYLFDTGSSLFNAQYNQSWWPGFTPSSDPTTGYTPLSTVTGGSGIQYCYGNGLTGCRGYKGNIVQAGTLDLYTPTTSPGGQTLVTSLNAAPGYQINAVYESSFDGTSTLVAGTTAPVLENQFYGVFGAGDFTTPLHTYTTSGVLGQTTVTGAIQGYMVAANGQTNPVPSSGNQPTQINGQNVLLGGVRQAVTSCSPCVKLGLTPEVIGQFAPVGLPGATGGTGLIRWAETGAAFINPYGGATGNNASTQFGINFNVTLTAGGTTVTSTSGGLLDTGTGGLTLSTVLKNQPGISTNTSVLGGVTFTATGLAPDGSSISGLSSSSSVLQAQGSDPITYVALFDQNAPGLTNTIGLSFFLQNSVLYDLSDNVIAYTPYFVTDANLVTTAGGPLIVESTNVPLGLAGVISGPGGVQIGNGGDVQLSATNTYTGATQIASGGRLLVSGPGSIAASSGVTNDGTFDISRAWAPISIAALTGAGTTYLGANTLVLTNASGTFSGSIADGGSYPVGGGSLTIAGGTQGLSGANSYSGATTVQAGAQLNLLGTGNIVSSSGLANNGTFDI
ncbi:autotransporter-associated beta strand repeat-containing protein, partial [Enhydrobacter aerosaccus]